MNDNELLAYVTLALIPGLGHKRLTALLSKGSPEQLLAMSKVQWRNMGLNDRQTDALNSEAPKKAEQCLQWAGQKERRHILLSVSGCYPPLFKQIGSPPPLLFAEGTLSAVYQPQIAIVGSRNASLDGQARARQIAAELVGCGLAVTSGMALGIDGYAHDGALRAGGSTIAVLGSGLKHMYPARHRQLAERIKEQGALLSEFCPDVLPRPEHFPRRNRIISGLSVGVILIEAAEKSGSLITARYAAEQGRDVFVVPGPPEPGHYGSNRLIQSGACLIQSVDEVMTEVATLVDWSENQQKMSQKVLFPPANEEHQLPFAQLLANVGREATPVDILASRTNIPVQEIMMQLLELELLGHVVAVQGGYILKGRG